MQEQYQWCSCTYWLSMQCKTGHVLLPIWWLQNRTADVLRNRIVELFFEHSENSLCTPSLPIYHVPSLNRKDHHNIHFTSTGLVTRPWKWLPELTQLKMVLWNQSNLPIFSPQILPRKSPKTLDLRFWKSLQEIPGWSPFDGNFR